MEDKMAAGGALGIMGEMTLICVAVFSQERKIHSFALK